MRFESRAYKASAYATAGQRAQAPLKAGARARARGKRRASKLGRIAQILRRTKPSRHVPSDTRDCAYLMCFDT